MCFLKRLLWTNELPHSSQVFSDGLIRCWNEEFGRFVEQWKASFVDVFAKCSQFHKFVPELEIDVETRNVSDLLLKRFHDQL
jgi:hypothetical protein